MRPNVALRTPQEHEDFRGVSLCAGVGGLDLGLHLALPGYRTVCFVERYSFAAATLVARMADASLAPALVWDDLRSFDGRAWRGRIHILTAGYPCQPFTLSGLRRGEDDPRHLWPEVARIADEMAPEWVFFENVPGHLSLGFQDVARDLQAMGYRVAACVVSASEVDGTHTRERMFILGHADFQGVGQSGMCPAEPRRIGFQDGPEPDGQTNGPEESGGVLDLAVGSDGGAGVEGRSLPVFPPEPGDFALWRETLDRCPDLKPGLQRLADGLADRMDRSATAGNGVVPLAAARAFTYLSRELQR